MSDQLDYSVPELTFGTEQEFSYIITRELYYRYLGRDDPRDKYAQQPLQIQEDQESVPDVENVQLVKDKASGASPKSSQPEFHSGSTTSTTQALIDNVIQYVLDVLNRNLVDVPQMDVPQTPSILGKVQRVDPNEADHTQWCLTYESVISPSRAQYATKNNLPKKAIRARFNVSAAELVGPITNLESNWVPMYEQIQSDLNFDGEKGLWFNGYGGLHVHFGFKNRYLDFESVRNLMALYGLYEREIETWLEVRRRDLRHPFQTSPFCRSIRRGMERRPGLKYTPQEYTERLYGTSSLSELREEVGAGGRTSADGVVDNTNDFAHNYKLKYVSVYISPQQENDNKVETLDFRQHEATANPETIKWWVLFRGRLLQYAHHLAIVGTKILDDTTDGVPKATNESFVGQYIRTSILDTIFFPKEGEAHFQRRAQQMRDAAADAQRALELKLVEARVERRAKGERTGVAMEANILEEPWYSQEAAHLYQVYGIDLREAHEDQHVQDHGDYWDEVRQNRW